MLWLRLLAFLRGHGRRYDAWHVHIAHYLGAIACRLGAAVGTPTIVKVSGWWELERGLLAPHIGRLARIGRHWLRRASALQAISQRIAAELARAGFPRERILALPNAVDTGRFARLPRSAAGDDRLDVLFVGRLVPEKDLPSLLEAWTRAFPERGRALMRLQDEWLGELVSVLEKNHMLSNTIIVVTSDHGVRDKVDDPAFNIGMIDEYSYHVPLMIYCPALPKRVDIPWITSHVDIAPTVLDLLGAEQGRSTEEGAPMWQDDLRGRTTFFLASHYMGADGYFKDNKFYMVKYLAGSAYESPEMHFTGEPMPEKDANEVKDLTSQLNAIQAAMFYKFAFNVQKPPRN